MGTEYSAAGSADLEEMLAEDLRRAGYRVAFFGKLGVSVRPEQRDEMFDALFAVVR